MRMTIYIAAATVSAAMALSACVASAPSDSGSSASRPLPSQPSAAPESGRAEAAPPSSAAAVRPIGYAALKAAIEAPGSRVLVLDVRTQEEYAEGYIPGAVLAPYDELEASFAEADKKRPIVVYCRSGRRSAIAAETLLRMGYADVSDFGGVGNWRGPLKR